jgi:hypothetical protein
MAHTCSLDSRSRTHLPRSVGSHRPQWWQLECGERVALGREVGLLLYFAAVEPSDAHRDCSEVLLYKGGAEGIRTPGLLVANEARYQLRHSPLLRCDAQL